MISKRALPLLALTAQRLRGQPKPQPIPVLAEAAPMPGLSAAAGSAAQAAGQDRLPPADALTATEQAIQLDELIKWVRAQAEVDQRKPSRRHCDPA